LEAEAGRGRRVRVVINRATAPGLDYLVTHIPCPQWPNRTLPPTVAMLAKRRKALSVKKTLRDIGL